MSCVILTDHVTKSIETDVAITDTFPGKSKLLFYQKYLLRCYTYLQFAMNDLSYKEKKFQKNTATELISLHISYLVTQPIKTSVLFLNMVRTLILILQVKYDKFCWTIVKNEFHYERNHISAYIYGLGVLKYCY